MDNRRVIALGFFDGVHTGHAALLKLARQRADQYGIRAAALSFDRHPSNLVSKHPTPLLNTGAERELLMRRLYAIDEVHFAPFDEAMMNMPWQQFVQNYLIEQLHAVHVICGHNFRFGFRAEGTPQKLQAFCQQHGIGCDVVDPVMIDGQVVSSTRIRQFLSDGDAHTAARFLAHPHLITGYVSHGHARGSAMGIPTANLHFSSELLIPRSGVYCAAVCVNGSAYAAAVNIGVHPTVGSLPQPQLEAWLLDFSGDLYEKEIAVYLLSYLRPERKFDSVQELQSQILSDAQMCSTCFKESSYVYLI